MCTSVYTHVSVIAPCACLYGVSRLYSHAVRSTASSLTTAPTSLCAMHRYRPACWPPRPGRRRRRRNAAMSSRPPSTRTPAATSVSTASPSTVQRRATSGGHAAHVSVTGASAATTADCGCDVKRGVSAGENIAGDTPTNSARGTQNSAHKI